MHILTSRVISRERSGLAMDFLLLASYLRKHPNPVQVSKAKIEGVGVSHRDFGILIGIVFRCLSSAVCRSFHKFIVAQFQWYRIVIAEWTSKGKLRVYNIYFHCWTIPWAAAGWLRSYIFALLNKRTNERVSALWRVGRKGWCWYIDRWMNDGVWQCI